MSKAMADLELLPILLSLPLKVRLSVEIAGLNHQGRLFSGYFQSFFPFSGWLMLIP